jgi:hypothetical protein
MHSRSDMKRQPGGSVACLDAKLALPVLLCFTVP